MRKIIRTSLLFQILLLLPLLTKAELVQGEVYAGASMGVPIYDKLDKTDVGFKVYGGYMLYDFIGLDIGYVSLGDPKADSNSLEVSGANVAAMVYLPINRQISLFAKAGSFIWDAKRSPGSDNSSNSISFAAGADFSAMDNIFIHGEIERYTIDKDESIIMYSIGLKAAF